MVAASTEQRKPTVISLFSGCGGFDLGFHQQGFNVLAAYDIEKSAVNVYNNNFPSVAQVKDLSSIQALEGIKDSVDVVIAGPPCQGFSTLGKRRLDDPRNGLLPHAAKLACSVNPQIIVIENVASTKSGKHKKYWDEMTSTFNANGYLLKEFRCDSTYTGLPQSRVRLICVAYKKHLEINELQKLNSEVTLKDLLNVGEDLKNHTPMFLEKKSPDYQISQSIKQGQKLCNVRGGENAVPTWSIPNVFGKTCCLEKEILIKIQKVRRQVRVRDFGDADPVDLVHLQSHFDFKIKKYIVQLLNKKYIKKVDNKVDFTHGFNGKYKRLSWAKPSPTVDTKFGNPRYFIHPEEHRGLTVREAARIQGFPDWFEFSGSEQVQYRLIGNAVPPTLSGNIAQMILESFNVKKSLKCH